MTLADLLKLIRHYFGLFISIVVASLLVGGVLGFVKTNSDARAFSGSDDVVPYSNLFMAQSTILTSSQVGGVGGIADAEAGLWNQAHNERYGEWLVFENERMQEQLNASTNTSSKKSVETAPGSWLKSDNYYEFEDLTIVETQTFENSNTVLVVAIGPEASSCIDAANEVAEKTEEVAHSLFDGESMAEDAAILRLSNSSTITLDNEKINITLIKAVNAYSAHPLIDENVALITANKTAGGKEADQEPPSAYKTIFKFGIIGFAGGVVFALLVVLLINLVRKPIKNGEEIAANLGVPALLLPDSRKDGEMVFVNMKLASGDDARNVSVASVHDPSASIAVYSMIEKYDTHNDPLFNNIGSLTTSSSAVESASDSDGVVLCMREWKDTVPELEDALNEIAIADTRIIGIAALG